MTAPATSGRRVALAVALLLALVAAPLLAGAPAAHAAGSASRAVGFIEDAQNSDGGFGAKKGGASDADATLWASVALLAAGKHPRDEFLKNGRSAEQWLVGHLGAYGSLEQLGLLALVQNTSRLGASAFGHPLEKIEARLSESAVRADPRGAAFAIFGLLSADSGSARAKARAAAQSLLTATTSDGAWGPDGNADSSSTAVVLQALAATGVADRDAPQVRSGFDYLRAAQINDGALAESTRLDKASAAGSVSATAYAIQAVAAFGVPPIRTQTGKTLAQGLTDYQQQTSGGLTSKGGQYSQVPPSVVETAQAFPAFDGLSFRLAPVKSTSGGPDAARRRADAKRRAAERRLHDTSQKRESSGSSDEGASSGSAGASGRADPGAFERATAGGGDGGSGERGDRRERGGRRAGAGERRAAAETPADGGEEVTGDVVRAAGGPALRTRRGADDSGLTNRQRATLAVGGLLGLLLLAGIALERLRPRPSGARPLPTEAIVAAQRAARPFTRGAAAAAGVHVRDAA
ncbi:prenyltransferase/squalene oxidase repeat-containing protein, partial [Conexibacter sp. CPCC 205706]